MQDIAWLLMTPKEVQEKLGERTKALRLRQNITQKEVAQRAGIALATLKRFEKTGEIQLRHFLQVMLVLGTLDLFKPLLIPSDTPTSLFHPTPSPTPRQRARSK